MSAVIVDPSEMRSFERALRELSDEVDVRRLQLERQVIDMRSFWDDEKYASFTRNQEVLMLEMQVFTRLCDRYSEYLRRKAVAAEAYLGH